MHVLLSYLYMSKYGISILKYFDVSTLQVSFGTYLDYILILRVVLGSWYNLLYVVLGTRIGANIGFF